jgi:hypothetical protein
MSVWPQDVLSSVHSLFWAHYLRFPLFIPTVSEAIRSAIRGYMLHHFMSQYARLAVFIWWRLKLLAWQGVSRLHDRTCTWLALGRYLFWARQYGTWSVGSGSDQEKKNSIFISWARAWPDPARVGFSDPFINLFHSLDSCNRIERLRW